MPRIQRFDHIGITVADLDLVTAFFVGLGLEIEGRASMEGAFVDTVIGIPNSRSQVVTLFLPDGGTKLELSSFSRPDHEPGSPRAMSTELGLRNVCFEVDDLQAIVDRLAADGYGLVGGIGQYEDIWRMAYVRGPEGIIVALAQRIDRTLPVEAVPGCVPTRRALDRRRCRPSETTRRSTGSISGAPAMRRSSRHPRRPRRGLRQDPRADHDGPASLATGWAAAPPPMSNHDAPAWTFSNGRRGPSVGLDDGCPSHLGRVRPNQFPESSRKSASMPYGRSARAWRSVTPFAEKLVSLPPMVLGRMPTGPDEVGTSGSLRTETAVRQSWRRRPTRSRDRAAGRTR